LDLSNVSVLVIDDHEFIRSAVTKMLRAFGIRELVDMGDAAEALQLMDGGIVNLVVCDYLMSPMSGIDFTRAVRAASDSQNQEVPIILLTGHTRVEVLATARDAGVTDILAKPVSPKTLLNRIVHVFDNPREFIRSPTYAGPDRRRRSIPWPGVERRGAKGTTR
jgi:two-component system, chemotaxis family, chemotaxis protein CheY